MSTPNSNSKKAAKRVNGLFCAMRWPRDRINMPEFTPVGSPKFTRIQTNLGVPC